MNIWAFRAAVEAIDTMMAVFADEVRFHSPIVYKSYEGKGELRFVLAGVMPQPRPCALDMPQSSLDCR